MALWISLKGFRVCWIWWWRNFWMKNFLWEFLVTFYWIFFKIFDYILSLLPLFAIFWVLENATKISLMSFDSPAVSEDWYKRGGYSSTYSHIKNYFGGRFWISESVHTGRSVYGSLKEGLVGRHQSWHEEERKKEWKLFFTNNGKMEVWPWKMGNFLSETKIHEEKIFGLIMLNGKGVRKKFRVRGLIS
jgi:hypothetical protein